MSEITTTSQMLVKAKEVQVGDRVISFTSSLNPSDWYDADWQIVRIDNGNVFDSKGVSCFGLAATNTFKIERTTTAFELTAKEIRVGDHVTGYRGRSESTFHPTDWVIARLPTDNEPWHMTDDGRAIIHTTTTALLRVSRSAGSKPTPTGKWNGKCSTCKKNTYTGFLQVEHEGGACQ